MAEKEVAFDLSKPLKRANLLKQGAFHKAFKHREFVLYPGFLVYYESEKSWLQDISKGTELGGRLGAVKLKGATIGVARNAPKACKYGFMIAAPDPENKRLDYLINASSREERDEWIEALRKATPLPGKNLVRRTTALKAALTLSTHICKEEERGGRGIDDVSDFDEELCETNLDDVLVLDEVASSEEVGGVETTTLSEKVDVEATPDKSEESSTTSEELPAVAVHVLEASSSPTQREKADSKTSDNQESVVEVEIEVCGIVTCDTRNSSENNNKSSTPRAVGPSEDSSSSLPEIEEEKKQQDQQHKKNSEPMYHMVRPGVFQYVRTGKWEEPMSEEDAHAQKFFVPGVGWRVRGMNAETEDAPEKSMQVSVGDKTVEGTEEGAEIGEIKSAKVETKATVLEAEAYRSIVSYKAESVGQISFDTGETLYVLHKLQDGWWYVSNGKDEGWAPCSYLEGEKDDEGITDLGERTERYCSVDVYEAEEADEVGLRRGEEVEVMQKSIDGWWTVKLASGKVGLAPATFLKKMEDKFSSTSSSSPKNKPPPIPKSRVYQQPPRKTSIRAKARLLQAQRNSTAAGGSQQSQAPPTRPDRPLNRPASASQQTSAATSSPHQKVRGVPHSSRSPEPTPVPASTPPPPAAAAGGGKGTKEEPSGQKQSKPVPKVRTKSPLANSPARSKPDKVDSRKRGKSPVNRTRSSNQPETSNSEELPPPLAATAAAATDLEEPKRPAQRPRITEIREAKIRARSLNKQPKGNLHLGTDESQHRRSSRVKSESNRPHSKLKTKKSDSKSESKRADSKSDSKRPDSKSESRKSESKSESKRPDSKSEVTKLDSKEIQERTGNSAGAEVEETVEEGSNFSSSATSSDTSGKSTPSMLSPERSKSGGGSPTPKNKGEQENLLDKSSQEENECVTSPKRNSKDDGSQTGGSEETEEAATDETSEQKPTSSLLGGKEADVANTLLQYIMSSEDPAVKAALCNIVQNSGSKVGEV